MAQDLSHISTVPCAKHISLFPRKQLPTQAGTTYMYHKLNILLDPSFYVITE